MRVYRASSLGYSLEQLVAPHLGYEPVSPPDFLQLAYDEGNRLEPIAIEYMQSLGWEISGEQDEVTIEIVPGAVNIVGHIDGYGWHPTLLHKRYVIEIKTMAEAAFRDFESKGWASKSPLIEKYKWQQSAYVIATGLPHVLIAWDKSAEQADPRTWTEVTYEPFYPVEVLANKVLAAEQHIRDGVLPEGCEDFPCPFFYLHADKEKVPVEKADQELEDKLAAWMVVDQDIKKLEKAKKSLRDQIVGKMEDAVMAAKVKGACGVTVSTNWVEEKHVEYNVKAHWETRIQGPRNVK